MAPTAALHFQSNYFNLMWIALRGAVIALLRRWILADITFPKRFATCPVIDNTKLSCSSLNAVALTVVFIW